MAFLAVLALVTTAAVWQAKRRPYVFAGWFWFLGLLVPVLGLVQVGSQAHADRYSYLPGIGLLVIVTWAAAKLAQDSPLRKRLLGAVAVLAVLACAVATNRQARYWKSAETLFARAVSVTRNNLVAMNNLAPR